MRTGAASRAGSGSRPTGGANGVTSLDVFEPCPEPALEVDAGVVVADAGVEPGDAGTEPEPDAGPTPPRSAPLDAGEYDPMTRKFRPGCECGSAPLGLALAAVLSLARRRPSRRVSSGTQKR